MGKTKFFEGLKDWKAAESEQQPDPVSTPSGDDQQAQGAAVRKSEDSKIKTFENGNVRKFEDSNRATKRRGNKSEWARAVVTIEPKQYKKIKKHCLENDTTFQAFIEGLITHYFEEKGR